MYFIRTQYSLQIASQIQQFLEISNSIITGSLILKLLMHDYVWPIGDIDILVPLNKISIDAFKQLLISIASPPDPKPSDETSSDDDDDDNNIDKEAKRYHVLGYNRLSVRSFQPQNAPEIFRNEKELTEDEKNEEEKERNEINELDTYLSETVKDIAYGYNNQTYSRHTRSAHFCINSCIGAKDKQIDFVFIPEPDIARAGSLINWMKFNFDLQICANAITAKSAYSYAPFEIARREAFLRNDHYCCDILRVKPRRISKTDEKKAVDDEDQISLIMKEYGIQLTHKKRFAYQPRPGWRCRCDEIGPTRIKKYEDRGYNVSTGSYEDYLKWKRNPSYTYYDNTFSYDFYNFNILGCDCMYGDFF